MFTWVGVKLVSTAVGLEVLAEGWGQSSLPPLAGMLIETRLALDQSIAPALPNTSSR